MIDTELRRALSPALDRGAQGLERLGVRPMTVTLLGLAVALLASVAACVGAWNWALVLWLVSRVFDGLDGPLARRTGRDSTLGGWADISSDMAAYGAFVAACGIGNPVAAPACLVLLVAYYVNGASLLALSSAVEARGHTRPDERTFHFGRGLAEGFETIVVHSLMVLVPSLMAPIAWGFTGVVLLTIGQRIVHARKVLP